MEYLWKKEANGDYIDFFAKVRDASMFGIWDNLLTENIQWLSDCEQFRKNNQTSLDYFDIGYRKYVVGNFSGALMSYNQSLCFAIPGSVNESLAYGNRSKCFIKMKLYREALTDIRLASRFQHSKRVSRRLNSQRIECEKQLMLGLQIVNGTPKLDYPSDCNFSGMANVLEIRNNNEFGRHIVAKCNIDAGKVILVNDVFASATTTASQLYCRNCNRTEQNLVPCPNCTHTMFCCGQKSIHQLECCTIFHVIGDTTLKLSIETILMAIDMFPSIKELKKYIEKVLKENHVPKMAKDPMSRYGLFLKLTQSFEFERIYSSYQAYTTLMALPKVNRLFNSKEMQTFLMHLTLHHHSIIPKNSFHHERFNRDWIWTDYIYDVMSLINHSCVPNVFNFSTSNEIGHCVTVKSIQEGEQIFINYLGNECKKSKDSRRKALKMWGFDCKCVRCEAPRRPSLRSNDDNKKIIVDPSFKYIMENCQKSYCRESNCDFGIRPKLKRECVQILQRFGHLVLTPEINFVRHCFTLH
ncbi:uncharacterized protein LOC116341058 [Contarinia nasturtii]|uniref:uncharacterized protein LOC116341058 n=1 Tax=Contarinia nasturtii TaxID=265458 RepID=UPI0012D39907|nr:uncharacterized protein LOC116341058 [Contarinia nasturtii]